MAAQHPPLAHSAYLYYLLVLDVFDYHVSATVGMPAAQSRIRGLVKSNVLLVQLHVLAVHALVLLSAALLFAAEHLVNGLLLFPHPAAFLLPAFLVNVPLPAAACALALAVLHASVHAPLLDANPVLDPDPNVLAHPDAENGVFLAPAAHLDVLHVFGAHPSVLPLPDANQPDLNALHDSVGADPNVCSAPGANPTVLHAADADPNIPEINLSVHVPGEDSGDRCANPDVHHADPVVRGADPSTLGGDRSVPVLDANPAVYALRALAGVPREDAGDSVQAAADGNPA